LTYKIAEALTEHKIETKYVNSQYLESALAQERIQSLLKSIDSSAKPNSDLGPHSQYLDYWKNQFKASYLIAMTIFLALGLIYLVFTKPYQTSLFTTGFAASSIQIALIVAFQAFFGYAYYQMVFFAATFMTGAAIGSYLFIRIESTQIRFQRIEIAIAAYAALIIPAIFLLRDNNWAPAAFNAMSLVTGFIAGSQLSFAAQKDTAGKLFSADLIGASFGALFAAAILIPILGVVWTLLMVAGIKVISAAVFSIGKQ
ncbi:MAG: hypothetical protein ABIF10_02885, partial [Candidatus Woesearchaeota archaeon]